MTVATAIAMDDMEADKPYFVHVGEMKEWKKAPMVLNTANRELALNYCKRAAKRHSYAVVKSAEFGVIMAYINNAEAIT